LLPHIISLFFFAAAIQGIFLACVLGLHRQNAQANHILAAWVALLSIDILQQIYYAEEYYKQFPTLIGVCSVLPLSYGGFLFLYVRSLTQVKPLSRRDILHFAGFIVGFLINLPLILQSSADKIALVNRINLDQTFWSLEILEWLTPLIASIYAVASWLLFSRQQKTKGITQGLSWLRTMLVINSIIWVTVWLTNLLTYLIPNLDYPLENAIIYLLVSAFVYIFGYFSLRQPELFIASSDTSEPSTVDSKKNTGPKYGDNRLPDDLRTQILNSLDAHMNDHKPWRENNFTIAQLAEGLGLSSHHISQVLNDHRGQSFNDYLNQFRIEAVCQRLQHPSPDTLLDIAMQCGFSSKSSFNAIFKKFTGKTPSAYRQSVQH
jgi:AraC-like DNA-binding protein